MQSAMKDLLPGTGNPYVLFLSAILATVILRNTVKCVPTWLQECCVLNPIGMS